MILGDKKGGDFKGFGLIAGGFWVKYVGLTGKCEKGVFNVWSCSEDRRV